MNTWDFNKKNKNKQLDIGKKYDEYLGIEQKVQLKAGGRIKVQQILKSRRKSRTKT